MRKKSRPTVQFASRAHVPPHPTKQRIENIIEKNDQQRDNDQKKRVSKEKRVHVTISRARERPTLGKIRKSTEATKSTADLEASARACIGIPEIAAVAASRIYKEDGKGGKGRVI